MRKEGCQTRVCTAVIFVSLYREKVMKSTENMSRKTACDHNVINLSYADDTDLITTSQKELHRTIEQVVLESEKWASE